MKAKKTRSARAGQKRVAKHTESSPAEVARGASSPIRFSGIQWPAHWAADKGWPTATTPLADGSGRTFGALADEAGIDLDEATQKLGKETP